MPANRDYDSNAVKGARGAQAPHKSPYEGVLRDTLFYALREDTIKRQITVAQVYPKIRHREWKLFAGGKDGEPEAFSLSKLLQFADALNARPVVRRALCEAAA